MITKKSMWMLLILMSVLLLSACGSAELTKKGTNVSEANWTVADFNYTDQSGNKFGLNDLKGDVWLANFIFTSCTTVCPVTTAHMAKLQEKLDKAGVSVPMVSFSVNPKKDTPETLKSYGKKFGADFTSWHFLTGYSFKEIKQFSEESFKSAVAKPAGDSNQFTHGTSIYLIKSNEIIKSYPGVSDTPYKAIVQDVKALTE